MLQGAAAVYLAAGDSGTTPGARGLGCGRCVTLDLILSFPVASRSSVSLLSPRGAGVPCVAGGALRRETSPWCSAEVTDAAPWIMETWQS